MRLRRPLPDDMRESRSFAEIAFRAQEAYRPLPYEGAMVVFRSHGLYYEDDLGWRAFVRGPVDCHEVPGRHSTPRDAMREPAVGFVAQRLEEAALRAAAAARPSG